jgi:hypothetical protein
MPRAPRIPRGESRAGLHTCKQDRQAGGTGRQARHVGNQAVRSLLCSLTTDMTDLTDFVPPTARPSETSEPHNPLKHPPTSSAEQATASKPMKI